MSTVLPSSVTTALTWLAAASSRLTGDRPALVACVLAAATRFSTVASARASIALTSSDAAAGVARTSSIMVCSAFTTAFVGARTAVGAGERPALRRSSTPDRKAVT
jgi:hypothetical protein